MCFVSDFGGDAVGAATATLRACAAIALDCDRITNAATHVNVTNKRGALANVACPLKAGARGLLRWGGSEVRHDRSPAFRARRTGGWVQIPSWGVSQDAAAEPSVGPNG